MALYAYNRDSPKATPLLEFQLEEGYPQLVLIKYVITSRMGA